jgi:hypothetical protein
MIPKLYLSRRNLQTLLDKLDAQKNGAFTACSIIKFKNYTDSLVSDLEGVQIIAVEDNELYNGREPGKVVDVKDLPLNSKPTPADVDKSILHHMANPGRRTPELPEELL